MDTSPKYRRLSANERRDQILDAANALRADFGYELVTVGHIAKAAGVARGLVHHYSGGRKRSTSPCSSASPPAARKT